VTVTIDYDKLNTKQKQTYDFLVKVAKQPIDEKLEMALGLVGKPKPRVRKEIHEDKEKVAREAEAVLLHLRRVDTLMQKECLECHSTFATNYHFAGRCSDDCIKASLARVGIAWNPEKSAQERWNGPGVNGEIPAIIEPDTLAFLKTWATTILSWDKTPGELEHEQHMKAHEALMPAQPFMVNGKQNGWNYPMTFKTDDPRLGSLEPPSGFLEEIQGEEEALREEALMSGDLYGGTDTTEIDWDSL
jgi:hypothetical protein